MCTDEVEIYNPHNAEPDSLVTIYGFNNGDVGFGNFDAALVSSTGQYMGGHICSNEHFMFGDLGIQKGTREDRHNGFREKFPDGYKMEFVPSVNLKSHDGLNAALKLYDELHKGETK